MTLKSTKNEHPLYARMLPPNKIADRCSARLETSVSVKENVFCVMLRTDATISRTNHTLSWKPYFVKDAGMMKVLLTNVMVDPSGKKYPTMSRDEW